jgi:hypothetical protein
MKMIEEGSFSGMGRGGGRPGIATPLMQVAGGAALTQGQTTCRGRSPTRASLANGQNPIELKDAQPQCVPGAATDRQWFISIDRDATFVEIKTCRRTLAPQPRETFLLDEVLPPICTCLLRDIF